MGGVIVLAFGAQAAFGLNALLYLPMLLAFVLWRRRAVRCRACRRKGWAAQSCRARAMSSIRRSSSRTLIRAVPVRPDCGATASALAPLIARDLLGGDAAMFGLLLGAAGVGAVARGAVCQPGAGRFGTENGHAAS